MSSERTSLHIDDIPLESNGVIGMCACPGRNHTSKDGTNWHCDLKQDVATIVDWRADFVLTLLEPREFDELGVPTLPSLGQKNDFQWLFFPIPDLQPPDINTTDGWYVLARFLSAMLSSGKRVLVHCAAGKGRTGTVAAALLIELGWNVDEAIKLVRDSRPGTIESAEQMAFLTQYKPGLAYQFN